MDIYLKKYKLNKKVNEFFNEFQFSSFIFL